MGETKRLEISEINDISSKYNHAGTQIKIFANSVMVMLDKKYVIIFMFFTDKKFFGLFKEYLSRNFVLLAFEYRKSEKAFIKYCATNIPITARKDSQRPISYTEFGDINKIKNREKSNVVSKSFSSCKTNATYTVAAIIKALTVEVGNPHKAR